MERIRLLPGLLLVLVVSALVQGIPVTAGPAGDASPGRKRLEKAIRFEERWDAGCDEVGGVSDCRIPALAQVSVRTPETSKTVDAVASVTFDYRVSRGDRARVS